MATLLLQAAGAFLGGMFGSVGAAIGTAAGALGGYVIDQSIMNSMRRVEGPRMTRPSPLNGEDGSPLARVLGVSRVSGTLIWATRLEEASKTERQGGKGGGPKVTTYSYFANFAVAICDGEISHVRRIWADGQELDLTQHDIRIYKGSEDQQPDPLIAAKQGADNTPTYRGTAYVVFDRFALDDFGNRIPQLQFEVIRTGDGIADKIEAVTIIPGSTEFGLSPTLVNGQIRPGETVALNRHVLNAEADWKASLDELQALCPNLKKVALVVAWFGTDLRAGQCQIKPGVSTASAYVNDAWRVAGMTRATAHVVSNDNGSAAYGGTPDDKSVIDAIADLRARSLEVTLYPFILMDIPAVNSLPSPYGGASQPAYPWRGDMTCDPAPGLVGSADATAAAASQVAAFAGSAAGNQFGHTGSVIAYSGPTEWGYRRMVLHYAELALAGGGVDGFLIGSEMKGLTRVRGTTGFPFVAALSSLANDVRQKLGPTPKIVYAADWSEYGAYMPPSSDDLRFPLDALWADTAIDAVGIDNYMPLSDWRDSDWDGGNPDGAVAPDDGAALEAAIDTGEGYDWYYATDAHRCDRIRTPITDGVYGKPWVYRFKDIRSWWMSQHFERINGVEQVSPTAWVPGSKPLWFTELGCPAIDKGANQPNLFSDPKSSAAGIPHFSNGGRDDAVQTEFLAAHFRHWEKPENNPVHPVTSVQMLDVDSTYLWAWDARPFPAFPAGTSVWGDGGNWLRGHWLNGRLSNVMLADLISIILAQHGISDVDTSNVRGSVGGFALYGPATAREALDPLLALCRTDVSEADGKLTFSSRLQALDALLIDQPARMDSDAGQIETIEADSTYQRELILQFRDPLADHKVTTARSGIGGETQSALIDLPLVVDAAQAQALVSELQAGSTTRRRTLKLAAPLAYAGLVPGDRFRLTPEGPDWRIGRIADSHLRELEAEMVDPPNPLPRRAKLAGTNGAAMPSSGPPHVMFLDLPLLPNETTQTGLRMAAWLKPWKPLAALSSSGTTGFTQKLILTEQAICGNLTAPLGAGRSGLESSNQDIMVKLNEGNLSSVSEEQLLADANACAVRSASGEWEVLQFRTAVEIAPDIWRLHNLLRGQLGTLASAANTGAEFVLLDAGVKNAGISLAESENGLNWQVGPVGAVIGGPLFAPASTGTARRAMMPSAPVHVTAKRKDDGSTELAWVRTGRADADGWDHPEIPLHEVSERYRIRLFTLADVLRRELTVTQPSHTYASAMKSTDFGAATQAILEVAQLDAGGLPGLAARRTISI